MDIRLPSGKLELPVGGIKSSTVAYYIKVLIKKGILKQESSKARNLKLASPLTTRGLAGVGTRGYPVLGRVPAGKPNLMEEEIEDTFWLVLNHAYLATLEAGRVRRTTLGTFAGQQYHIITSDLRSIALLVSRHGRCQAGDFSSARCKARRQRWMPCTPSRARLA